MASFMGGSGRITVFLSTVLVELTDDASLIFPVGLASIISMIVGNQVNHGGFTSAQYGSIFVQLSSLIRLLILAHRFKVAKEKSKNQTST